MLQIPFQSSKFCLLLICDRFSGQNFRDGKPAAGRIKLRQFTGVICPTCGMTRAWRACFRLELQAAFSYHPMFWSIPVLVLAFLLDGFAFPGKKATHVIYWVTLLGFAATWMIRILCSLCGVQTV